ncbi:DUF2163 domain-containing protein [Glacieibacterium frigidum]|uniref:DUF2163 domain-containing protein n=1 Tax=Glacieibacterium frigidum TaxID=2593303 RepID=A0A552U807_9SPHN|nr:DUF2163 domain-containing protein [Glacieibacterium frigidum]TRW14356.1 DUF2163 domain-containing protein [Glacieibacterium frigidum]
MIDAEVTTLAILWRIARADGVTLGFTTHDAPLGVGGMTYDSAPGMVPSAISTGDGLEVDTMEVAGALSAAAITAADLSAGRYDGARVTVSMVDWRAPHGAVLPLARGTLGEVSQSTSGQGGSFTAELRGPTASFDASIVELCSPECRAELGDTRCRVDLAGLTVAATASEAEPGRVAVSAADPRFAGGRLRVLAGPNAGLDRRIVDTGADTLDLDEPLPFALAAGTRVELREGCDKRFATCRDRFANALNFRGEPHVPGGDLLTRFPGV